MGDGWVDEGFDLLHSDGLGNHTRGTGAIVVGAELDTAQHSPTAGHDLKPLDRPVSRTVLLMRRNLCR